MAHRLPAAVETYKSGAAGAKKCGRPKANRTQNPPEGFFFGGGTTGEGKDFLLRNKDNGGLATVPILWDSASDSPEGRKLLRDQEQQQSMSSEGLVAAPCLSPWPLMTMTS